MSLFILPAPSRSAGPALKQNEWQVSHVHVGVRDLKKAAAWFEKVMGLQLAYPYPGAARFQIGALGVFLEEKGKDSALTLGFPTKNCDTDHKRLVDRGAVSSEVCNDKPYGVRAAYLLGPGALRIELEQFLSRE
ncbi:MAG: VOC family protein [Elusimicrobia bacterium]|nr:VOC family protein [Elusimicrobiota bacterium]